MNVSSSVLVAALVAATVPWLLAPADAAPFASPLSLHSAAGPSLEMVQYRRGWRRGYGGGAAVGLGIAGALIGGAIIGATQPYGYYGYAPGYYGPVYAAPAPYVGGDAVAYCQQRFQSYDPYSGTYLGFDGMRHPCP